MDSSPGPSREVLAAAIQNLDVCIAILAGDELRYVYVNEAYQRLAPNTALVGHTYREAFAEAAVAGPEQRLRRVLETGEPRHIEPHRIAGAADAAVWQGEITRVQGDPPSVALLICDVSDRVRSDATMLEHEEALRRANHRLGETLDHISEGTVVLDREGRYLYVSERAAEILGRPREALLGRRIGELFPYIKGSRFEEAYRQAGGTGQPVHFESFYPEPLNRWFEANCYPSGHEVTVHFRDITERRLADAALRQSEERCRALVLATSDLVFSVSPDWSRIRVMNGTGELASGTTASTSEWVDRYIEPADQPRVRSAIAEALRAGTKLETEYRASGADARQRWFFSRAVPLFGAQGEIVEWMGMASDITERKRSEEVVRDAAARYERQVRLFEGVASTTPDLVVVFDLQGRFLYANRRVLEVWGAELKDVVGKTLLEIGQGGQQVLVQKREIQRVIATRQPVKGEVAVNDPGSDRVGIYEYILTPVIGPDGEVENIAAITRDITDRRRSEELIRASEARFRGTFENAAVGMAHVDLDGRWLRTNAALCRITGYSREELHSKTFADITHPDDVEDDWAHANRLLAGELDRYSMETRYIRKDGSTMWANVTVTLDVEPTTGAKYFIAVIEDISGRKAAEARVIEALRVRDDFLSIAGHELKTPLATLLLQVQSALRVVAREPDNPTLPGRLERAASSGLRLEALINQLLDVSRITAHRLELTPERLSFGGVVRAVVDRFEESAARAGCPLNVQLERGVIGFVDRLRLEQIVTNLLSNAIKYGKGAAVEVCVHREGPRALLRVIDHGIGISMDQQQRIFERFERAVETREYGGFGLGLWIVRRLVELMGGAIRVDSAPGRGASFTVELPLDRTYGTEVRNHELH
jgi:PAS domain S-box-containing protein